MNALQNKIDFWVKRCFGFQSLRIRSLRFLEESIELVQASDITYEDCLRILEQVYNKPKGDPFDEIGDVVLNLASLSSWYGEDIEKSGYSTLYKLFSSDDGEIRKKQSEKLC